ncbi:MAG TPA: MarR family transcriptional regulator [Stellaceae bacterium]|nr:MarR family transcriptional regulator [Stellaceae bacterium]
MRLSRGRLSKKRKSRRTPARPSLSFEKTIEVRDDCLCLFVQRAARSLARRFDDAFRPLSLNHGQFSLLMSLNRPAPPAMGEVAALLGVDRTTLTAVLKALQRRRLVSVRADDSDKRSRRLLLTAAGRVVLAEAYPLWKANLREIEASLGPATAARLRSDLLLLGPPLNAPLTTAGARGRAAARP